MNQAREITSQNWCSMVLLLTALSLAGADVFADTGPPGFDFSVSPTLFGTELVPKSDTELKEARLHSGLGISMSGDDLFKLSMNYKMQGRLVSEGSQLNSVDQSLDASMQSDRLDDLFNIKAGISANSLVQKGGENYSYKISPGFSKSLHNVAKLDVRYNYELMKPSSDEPQKETKAYTLGLKGELGFANIHWTSAYSKSSIFRKLADKSKEIRDLTLKFVGKFDREKLSWKSIYSKSSIENDILTPAEGIETFSIQSRYEIVPKMLLELSTSKIRKTIVSSISQQSGHEIHHAAGITWSPSRLYSLVFNINKFNSSVLAQQDYYSSGKVIWFPQDNVKLSLGYGDKLLEDSRGLLFSVSLDLDKKMTL